MNCFHKPILPCSDNEVHFYLKNCPDNGRLELFVSVYDLDKHGGAIPYGEDISKKVVTINSSEEIDERMPVYSSPPYGESKLVTYKWVFESDDCKTERKISFVTTPYLDSESPVPVYITGNVKNNINCVFIPDKRYFSADDTAFLNEVGQFILSFFSEEFLRYFDNTFNFFINPFPGRAAIYGVENESVERPDNFEKISFANAKIILHRLKDTRDFSGRYNYFGIDVGSSSGFLHEIGHTIFSLKDEYDDGNHGQYKPYPNNWNRIDAAEPLAVRYFNSKNSVVKLKGGKFKICRDFCLMNKHKPESKYDLPCRDRIFYMIKKYILKEPINTDESDILYTAADVISLCDGYRNQNLFYDPAWIFDSNNKHISFKFIVIDGSVEINPDTYSVRPGNAPYFRSVKNEDTIDIEFSDKAAVSYKLFNLHDVSKENAQEFEFYLPYDSNISQIRLPSNIMDIVYSKSNYLITGENKVGIKFDKIKFNQLF